VSPAAFAKIIADDLVNGCPWWRPPAQKPT